MTERFRLTIVFDNYTCLEGFPTLWGFSAYIETNRYTLLFDTGSNGRVLLQNMERLGKNLQKAQALFLSHPHWDHIGGVDSVLERHPDMHLFLPDSFSKHMIRDLRNQVSALTIIGKEPQELLPGLYSTGTMQSIGGPGEHAAIFDTSKGPVVVTGCAHPGIVAIARRATEITGREIALLVGGFHLMYEDADTITDVIDQLESLGVASVCPTHCSGDLAIEMFAKSFKGRTLQGGIGRVVTL